MKYLYSISTTTSPTTRSSRHINTFRMVSNELQSRKDTRSRDNLFSMTPLGPLSGLKHAWLAVQEVYWMWGTVILSGQSTSNTSYFVLQPGPIYQNLNPVCWVIVCTCIFCTFYLWSRAAVMNRCSLCILFRKCVCSDIGYCYFLLL